MSTEEDTAEELGHDFSDPYCVFVSQLPAPFGGNKSTARACKGCGIDLSSDDAWRPCEPWNWREAVERDIARTMTRRDGR